MSNNRLRFEGLDELRRALQQLPQELVNDASLIVETSTQTAADRVRAAYPARTGNLRDHVKQTVTKSGVSVRGVVKNTAKHAWMFENGTQARHTKLGANRGSMPPGHVFVPIVARARRAMYQRLKDLLVSKGLTVSGDAG